MGDSPQLETKTYSISVKNGLLDSKHIKAMQINQKTSAIWCYLWFLDKITKIAPDGNGGTIGIVLGGKPIKLQEIADDLGVGLHAVRLSYNCLKERGYITNSKAPHGNIVAVTKAFKYFNKGQPTDIRTKESSRAHEESARAHQESTRAHEESSRANNKTRQGKQIKQTNIFVGSPADTTVLPKANLESLFYQIVTALGFGDTVKYTSTRKQKLKLRLESFGAEKLLQSAQNIRGDPYMQGDNPSGRRYGGIDYLLRNDEQVDKWLDVKPKATQRKKFA